MASTPANSLRIQVYRNTARVLNCLTILILMGATISVGIFFLIYLMVFVDLWILRLKKPGETRPFYAGGARKVPVLSIVGFVLILAILVGNAVQDPKIVSIGLPVAAACLVFSMAWAAVLKKRISGGK